MKDTIRQGFPATKACSSCKQEKVLSEFNKGKPWKDGLHPWCKACMYTRQRDRIARRKAAGFCQRCDTPSEKWLCPKHMAEEMANIKARASQGRCARCGNQAVPGKSACADCSNEKHAYQNTPEVKGRKQARYKQVKDAVFAAYGGYICACCGETTLEFLTLDHVNNDGKAHRKELGMGSTFYRRILEQGCPPGLRVLCYNCNIGRRRGVCPHELGRLRLVKEKE